MLPLLLMLFVAQVPCAPNDFTVVCDCKQGRASACEVLRATDPRLAQEIANANLAVRLAQQAAQAKEAAEAEASASAPEPPDCKGQRHHIISKPISKALEAHRTLHGRYKPRDPRFIAQARDENAHCGYQQWHRDVDQEVIEWLESRKNATPEQFEKFLREIYNRPAMRERFPHGF